MLSTSCWTNYWIDNDLALMKYHGNEKEYVLIYFSTTLIFLSFCSLIILLWNSFSTLSMYTIIFHRRSLESFFLWVTLSQWQWIYCSCVIQSSAVVTRSNMTWVFIWCGNDWGKICISDYIHKRHPISRPRGRVMWCLLWRFRRKLTVL